MVMNVVTIVNVVTLVTNTNDQITDDWIIR